METAVLSLFSEIIKLGAALLWQLFRLFGWVLVKKRWQRKADQHRTTRLITLPRDVVYDELLAFVRSLNALPDSTAWKPVYAISFETYVDEHGIKFFVSIPGHVHERVENWLETHIPGSSIAIVAPKDDVVARTKWDRAIELTMHGTHTPLMIKNPKHVAGTILSSFITMTPGNAVVMQWNIFKGKPQSPHVSKDSGINPADHKEKVSDVVLKGTVRIAARGEEARRLVRDAYAGLSVTHTFGVKFKPRAMLGSVTDRVNRRAGLFDYQIVLNAPEFVVVMGWPFDSVNVPGLGGARARPLAPTTSIPEAGPGTIRLAASNYPKTRGRTLALPIAHIPYHSWTIGPTGTGKSALLLNKAVQSMNQGLGVVVIEPKGDLAKAVLASVPRNRVDDVIWFDAADEQFPIGFDMLAGPNPEQTVAHLVGLFKSLYGDSWGPRLEYTLKHVLLTTCWNNLSLYDSKALLEDAAFRGPYVRKIKNIDTRRFWRKYDGSDIAGASVINKLDAAAGTSIMKHIVGQKNGLDIGEVIREGKILLVTLNEVPLGARNASMLGSMIVDQLWYQARLNALEIPEGQRKITHAIIDEVQMFTHLSTSLEEILAMARSYGLGFDMAHQHTGQKGVSSILSDLKNNTHTKTAFALKPGDATTLAPYFGPLKPADLEALGEHHVAISFKTPEGSTTVTGKTFPPPPPTGAGKLAQRISRAKYGRPVAEVTKEIESRYPEPVERKRPTIGSVEDEG